MTENTRTRLERAANAALLSYGPEHQMRKTVEEMAELGTELMHCLDGRPCTNRLTEETADAIITTAQMYLLHQDMVDEWLDIKLSRLEERIADYDRHDS